MQCCDGSGLAVNNADEEGFGDRRTQPEIISYHSNTQLQQEKSFSMFQVFGTSIVPSSLDVSKKTWGEVAGGRSSGCPKPWMQPEYHDVPLCSHFRPDRGSCLAEETLKASHSLEATQLER
jgi:hypothetical protein